MEAGVFNIKGLRSRPSIAVSVLASIFEEEDELEPDTPSISITPATPLLESWKLPNLIDPIPEEDERRFRYGSPQLNFDSR